MMCGPTVCAGVEPDQLQVEDEPLRSHWIRQHRYCFTRWISVCIRWQSMLHCCFWFKLLHKLYCRIITKIGYNWMAPLIISFSNSWQRMILVTVECCRIVPRLIYCFSIVSLLTVWAPGLILLVTYYHIELQWRLKTSDFLINWLQSVCNADDWWWH